MLRAEFLKWQKVKGGEEEEKGLWEKIWDPFLMWPGGKKNKHCVKKIFWRLLPTIIKYLDRFWFIAAIKTKWKIQILTWKIFMLIVLIHFFFRSTTTVHCKRNLSKSKYIFPLYLQIIALVTWLFSFLIYLQNILRADKAILIWPRSRLMRN